MQTIAISQYNRQNVYNYNTMVEKLIAENELFETTSNQLKNVTNTNKNNYINETTQNLQYIGNISHIVYYIFATVLCLMILTLTIPVWAMAIFILVIMTFPLYIHSIQQYLYKGMNYIHSLIMSIEYSPNDNI